jgi:hypothetical protein
MTIEVLLPVSPREAANEEAVEWRARSARPTIALVDNTMPLAGQLLAAAGRHAVAGDIAADVVLARKPAPSRSIPDDEWAALLEGADVLIAGVGVCGGCTSGSVRDAALALQSGIPAIAVVTTPFRQLAELTRKNLGAPDVRIVVLDHPLWTRDEAWLDAAGRDVAAVLRDVLASAPTATAAVA